MRKVISAILFLALTLFWSCTQTCQVSGIMPGNSYVYSYMDSQGRFQIGAFTVPEDSSTYNLTGIDDDIDCSSISVVEAPRLVESAS